MLSSVLLILIDVVFVGGVVGGVVVLVLVLVDMATMLRAVDC